MSTVKLAFRSDVHGFAFNNSWLFDQEEKDKIYSLFDGAVVAAIAGLVPLIPPDPILIGVLTEQLKGLIDKEVATDYGLCGGMAYASLDYYLANLVVQQGFSDSHPDHTTKLGGLLRDYIWQRLIDSFAGGNVALTTLQWMAILHIVPKEFSGGAGTLLNKTKEEWVKLKQYLDAGTPWPLGLIGMTKSPKDNHQVLAYGYTDNGNGTGTLYIYDNRRPGQECTIDLDFNGQELGVPNESCPDVERRELKGFFCSSYQQSSPPAALGLTQGMVITPPPPFIPGQTVSITYTATNVGFGSTPPVKLYVRGVQRIRVDPNEDASPGGLSAVGAGSNGKPPVFREQFFDFTSSAEENLQPASIASAFSDTPPHGPVFGTTVSRQLAAPAQWGLPNDESTWSFSAEVLLTSGIDGTTSYKALPAVTKQDKDSKEKEKEGKDSKDKEKEASKDRKDNKENLKEKEISKEKDRDGASTLSFSGLMNAGPAGLSLQESQASGQAFIRPEERPQVGKQVLR